MLAYILGITKWDNKGITNRGRFQGLQFVAKEIKNRGSLRDFQQGEKDYKSGQGFKIGASEITNRGRDFKSGQGLQSGAEHMR